jgi:hypothetical protein
MRITALLILVFSLQAAAECLVTFNVYGPIYAANIQERTHQIVDEIKSNHRCRIIHLQEAWNDSQIRQIERGLSQQFQIYSPNREHKIGLMSLAGQAWRQAQTFSFNVNYEDGFLDRFRRVSKVQKAFSVLKDSLPNTVSINTHLHPTSSAIRLMQIIDLFKWRVTQKNSAVVLSGDFNSEPGSLEHQLVRTLLDVEDAMLGVFEKYPAGFCTYCESNPLSWLKGNHVFDYVFLSHARASRSGWKAKNVELVLKGQAEPLSDHYGLRVDFEGAIFDSAVVPRKTKEAVLEVLIRTETDLLVSDHKQAAEYVQLLRTIESEIVRGQGSYAEYFAEILN